MIVITSRSGLESLRYRRDLVGIDLDVLPDQHSAQLVAELVGSADDPALMESVVAGCGGLPLAAGNRGNGNRSSRRPGNGRGRAERR